ncbi:MAG: tRNA (guanosine(46)-N7)-methyltransferase TrmB [Proteobacteria bacterium]|nr:tRNA (guanosine(46)-N7)-methyltransferase TrmB [Pseudomonadota bacterium]
MEFPLRKIKSFVRRGGRQSLSQSRALTELWPQYGLDCAESPIDLNTVFENPAPIVLEIGFGNGVHLLNMAIANPDKNYIGIEVYRSGIGSLLVATDKAQIKNLKVFCADAVDVLQHCIPDHSLSKVYILFPDPWPKLRHHKRRLIQKDFVDLLSKKLAHGGHCHCATDWQNYAEQMMEVFSAHTAFKNAYGSHQYAPSEVRSIETKFEQRGQRLGHSIWDLVFESVLLTSAFLI